MAALKYSRQRECIKNYLMSTTEHPTADTVYINVKKEFPNISLGTVYRNLNLLAEYGEIIKISTPDSGDRFDGNTKPHFHFFCTKCGKIIDIPIQEFPDLVQTASRNFNGEIEGCNVFFYGICEDCMSLH